MFPIKIFHLHTCTYTVQCCLFFFLSPILLISPNARIKQNPHSIPFTFNLWNFYPASVFSLTFDKLFQEKSSVGILLLGRNKSYLMAKIDTCQMSSSLFVYFLYSYQACYYTFTKCLFLASYLLPQVLSVSHPKFLVNRHVGT